MPRVPLAALLLALPHVLRIRTGPEGGGPVVYGVHGVVRALDPERTEGDVSGSPVPRGRSAS